MLLIVVILNILLYSVVIYSYLENKSHLFQWMVSSIASFIVASLLYSISLYLNFPFWQFLLMWSLIGVAGLIASLKQFKKPLIKIPLPSYSDIFFLIVLIYGTVLFFDDSYKWGQWDAWAIWTNHAKFLTDVNIWQQLFTAPINWSHPDYPLFLPSVIAILWNGLGEFNYQIPEFVAYLTFAGVLITFYAAFQEKRLSLIGVLFALVMVLNSSFVFKAASQYADTLVALFYLIVCIFLTQNQKNDARNYILLGLFASSCMWIKNEGTVFFILTSLIVAFQSLHKKRQIFQYTLGALPVLITYSIFKIIYAPVNDLVQGQSLSTIEMLTDVNRYIMVGKSLSHTLLSYPFLLLALLLILVFSYKKLFSFNLLLLFSTVAAYMLVYIITPHDLQWHLNTSIDRLIHQVYPAFLYSGLVALSQLVKDKFSGHILINKVASDMKSRVSFTKTLHK